LQIFAKNPASLSSQFATSADRRVEFHKSRQFFIRTHNQTLTVAAMCVCNKDCSPVGIQFKTVAGLSSERHCWLNTMDSAPQHPTSDRDAPTTLC